jgi:DNA-binding transcriptional ArsR family regulator
MLLSEQINSYRVERAAKFFSLMTHPMRINIIELLRSTKGLSVTEIYQKMNILQAEASHHLTLLKDFGIIKKKREGKKSIYMVDEEDFKKIHEIVDAMSAK